MMKILFCVTALFLSTTFQNDCIKEQFHAVESALLESHSEGFIQDMAANKIYKIYIRIKVDSMGNILEVVDCKFWTPKGFKKKSFLKKLKREKICTYNPNAEISYDEYLKTKDALTYSILFRPSINF